MQDVLQDNKKKVPWGKWECGTVCVAAFACYSSKYITMCMTEGVR